MMKLPAFTLWRDDKLLFVTLFLIMVFNWHWPRVLLRTYMEWDTFEWANLMGIAQDGSPQVMSGVGIYGASWMLIVLSMLLVTILWLGLRQRSRFVAGLLVVFTFVEFAKSLFFSYHLGHMPDYAMHWDTLGLVIPMAIYDPLSMGAIFLLALGWAWRETRNGIQRANPPWNRTNTRLLWSGIGLNIILAVTLNLGLQHGFWDVFSLFMMKAGFILIFLGMSPIEEKQAIA